MLLFIGQDPVNNVIQIRRVSLSLSLSNLKVVSSVAFAFFFAFFHKEIQMYF
jgi:hypothetical protein